MQPYQTIKLTAVPDRSDIRAEGRRSSVGKLSEPGGDFKPATRDARTRAATRRALKKRDQNRQARQARRDAV